jgi:3-keto-5-aminohexanoate cleavage enzyme
MSPDKIIINFCPTGMLPDRQNCPLVPITVSEIIEQVHEAYEMGITIAHLHAREDDGTPSYKKSIYARIFEGVRIHCPDLIICGSSSGRSVPAFEKRSEVVELQPDMCSLTLSSLNFQQQASMNAPDMIAALATKMLKYGVKPELECFDLGMINYGQYLIRKQLLTPPFYWNLLFGNISGMQASAAQIGIAVKELDSPDNYISLAGLGKDQLPVNAIAIALGYGVRVGLEDNIWWDEKRTIKASNAALLKRIHSLLDLHEKEFMRPAELGKLGFYNAQRIHTWI